jgi:hypothetical protein
VVAQAQIRAMGIDSQNQRLTNPQRPRLLHAGSRPTVARSASCPGDR